VPLDEGLTGTLTAGSRWPEGDSRNTYFNPENLEATRARVAQLEPLVPEGMDLPELALRFVLEAPAVSTTIPGVRQSRGGCGGAAPTQAARRASGSSVALLNGDRIGSVLPIPPSRLFLPSEAACYNSFFYNGPRSSP